MASSRNIPVIPDWARRHLDEGADAAIVQFMPPQNVYVWHRTDSLTEKSHSSHIYDQMVAISKMVHKGEAHPMERSVLLGATDTDAKARLAFHLREFLKRARLEVVMETEVGNRSMYVLQPGARKVRWAMRDEEWFPAAARTNPDPVRELPTAIELGNCAQLARALDPLHAGRFHIAALYIPKRPDVAFCSSSVRILETFSRILMAKVSSGREKYPRALEFCRRAEQSLLALNDAFPQEAAVLAQRLFALRTHCVLGDGKCIQAKELGEILLGIEPPPVSENAQMRRFETYSDVQRRQAGALAPEIIDACFGYADALRWAFLTERSLDVARVMTKMGRALCDAYTVGLDENSLLGRSHEELRTLAATATLEAVAIYESIGRNVSQAYAIYAVIEIWKKLKLDGPKVKEIFEKIGRTAAKSKSGLSVGVLRVDDSVELARSALDWIEDVLSRIVKRADGSFTSSQAHSIREIDVAPESMTVILDSISDLPSTHDRDCDRIEDLRSRLRKARGIQKADLSRIDFLE